MAGFIKRITSPKKDLDKLKKQAEKAGLLKKKTGGSPPAAAAPPKDS